MGRRAMSGEGHYDRIKTDVRLNRELAEAVEELCRKLDIPKNVFFTLAASQLYVQWCRSLLRHNGDKKRSLRRIIRVFRTMADRALAASDIDP